MSCGHITIARCRRLDYIIPSIGFPVHRTKLSVVGLDCLDGTPPLDIKPYFASTDSVPEAIMGWRKKD
jgi:tRNA (Thr-GGU) A37 N-methylase